MQFDESPIPTNFFNPFGQIIQGLNRLPHWEQPAATYFVTFRLADSLPKEVLTRLQFERETWLCLNPLPWTGKQEREYHSRFTAQTEHWLDQGSGECLLRCPHAQDFLREVLMRFDGVRVQQHAWVIMPNHVHVLFTLGPEEKLPKIMQAWKGVSSRAIGMTLQRSGPIWEKDYFDRLIRNSKHFLRCARYINENPTKAGLGSGEHLLYIRPCLEPLL